MKTCPKCSISHSKPGTYCSRTCANSRGPRTEEFKKILREKMTGRVGKSLGKLTAPREDRSCIGCGKLFTVRVASDKKYCKI